MGSRTQRKFDWVLWGGLILLAATLLLAFLLASLKYRFIGQPLPDYGKIAPFSLTNQSGALVTEASLSGKVWIADVIFTRCPGPCLKMTGQMKALQDALPGSSQTRLVSLTTDPQFDTPPVLARYAHDHGANPNRWMFLTGPKTEVANLAVKSLKLVAVEKTAEERENPQDLFIHSTVFVIVDKHGHLRGVFDTTGEGIDPQKVKRALLAAAHRLERAP